MASDLDVDQLATYLHLTPQQVIKLAERGQLPGRRVGQVWRFAEAELHGWLENRIGSSQGDQLDQVQRVVNRWSESGAEQLSLRELMTAEAIEIPLQARTRTAVIRRMCELGQATGLLWDIAKMTQAVEAREELHPTALDSGVALLHPRRPQTSILGGPLIVLGVTSTPIPFGNRFGHATDVFLLICSTDDRVHLQVLTKLSRVLLNSSFLDQIRHIDNSIDALELIGRAEEELHLIDSSAMSKR